MELAILITVNALISFLVYVAFSVRFRMALEKERKDRVPRQFYENLQMTIQYVNTAMSRVDERTESFYRLLLKSEEMVQRLETANAEFEKNLKRSRRKTKNPVEPPSIPDSSSPDQDDRGQGAGGSRSADYSSDLSWHRSESQSKLQGLEGDYNSNRDDSPGGEGKHVDRILAQMRQDRMEVTNSGSSVRDSMSGSSPSKKSASTAAPGYTEESPAPRTLLGRIGSVVGRIMGIDNQSFRALQQDDSESEPMKRPRNSEFDREVERMNRAPAHRQPKDSGQSRIQPADSSAGRPRSDYYVPSDSLENSNPSFSSAEKVLLSGANPNRNDSDMDGYSPMSGSGTGPAPSQSELFDPPPNSQEYKENQIRRVQDFVETSGINLLDTTPETRAVLIRELGSMGFESPDIIRATGFPPSEVSIVMDLPVGPSENRRRSRKLRT